MYIPILYLCFRGYQIGRPGEPSPWLKILNETTRTRKPLPAGTLCTEHMCSRRREKQVDSCAMSCLYTATLLPWFSCVTYFSKEPGEPSPWIQHFRTRGTVLLVPETTTKVHIYAKTLSFRRFYGNKYLYYRYIPML